VDLKLIDAYDDLLRQVELEIVRHAKHHDAQAFHLLDSVPGIGKILALVILYEVHDIRRFPRVQDFLSSCRLVKSKKQSAGKTYGTSGDKMGNGNLKWAFSQAAVLFLKDNLLGQADVARLEKKHGKGKALTILAGKLARAVYHMLWRKQAFDMTRFLNR
jgi:transposase